MEARLEAVRPVRKTNRKLSQEPNDGDPNQGIRDQRSGDKCVCWGWGGIKIKSTAGGSWNECGGDTKWNFHGH